MTTLLADPQELAGSGLEVKGEAYRHLFRAARLGAGDRLRVVDGRGRARWARVLSVGRGEATLELAGEAPAGERARRVELLVAAPRSQRASWLVEKATELGVAAVRFFNCERAPRGYGPATVARLRRVAAAALQQAERSRLPETTGVHGWEELPALLAPCERRWMLDPGDPGGEPLSEGASAALLVGPEGGWTEGERERLRAAGCLPLGLGPSTLRVETAALAGAALLLCR